MTDAADKNTSAKRRWTTMELRFLNENSASMTVEEMASALGRSPMSVFHFMRRNKIGKGLQNEWTKDELIILRTLFNAATREVIENILPRHTYSAIRHKAYIMGFVSPKKRGRKNKKKH